MNIFWIYKVIFTLLSIGLFLISFRRLYPQLKEYKKEYTELPDNLKSYIKKRAKNGLIKGIKHNKLLVALNIALLLILIAINVLVWVVRFG